MNMITEEHERKWHSLVLKLSVKFCVNQHEKEKKDSDVTRFLRHFLILISGHR